VAGKELGTDALGTQAMEDATDLAEKALKDKIAG
jgi:hypothetical protein